MRIAVPVDKKSLESGVSLSFGRVPYFLIYDSDTKEGLFLANSAASNTDGAGIEAAQIIVNNRTDILIGHSFGQNVFDVLKKSGIKLYRAKAVSAIDNINAFIAGELPLFDEDK